MTHRKVWPLTAVWAVFACAGVSCSNSQSAPSIGPPSLSGEVVDEQIAPIAGATVQISQTSLKATTASDGTFQILLPTASPNTLQVVVAHPGHAQTRRALLPSHSGNDHRTIMMHPVDLVTTVSVPSDPNAAPAMAALIKPIGTVSLAFSAGSLKTAAGDLVSGPVEVRLSYWGTHDDHIAAPSVMWAVEADGSLAKLDSLGMFDFTAHQNGNELLVVPGQNLMASLPLTPDQKTVFAGGLATLPNVYAVDPNAGIWSFVAPMQSGPNVTSSQKMATRRLDTPPRFVPVEGDPGAFNMQNVRYSVVDGQMTFFVQNSHAWNIDLGLTLETGGCQTGTTVDACSGKILKNAAFSTYVLDVEQVAMFTAKSDGNGHFCFATPFSTYSNGPSQVPATTFIAITDLDDYSSTAYCNPAANHPDCFTKHTIRPFGSNVGQDPCWISFISGCRMGNSDVNPRSVRDQGYAVRYSDSCPASTTLHRYTGNRPEVMTVYPCTFCSGSSHTDGCTANYQSYDIKKESYDRSCQDMGKVRLSSPTCNCDAYGTCSQTQKKCDNSGNCGNVTITCDQTGKCTTNSDCINTHTLGSPCFVDPTDSANNDAFRACCSKDKKAWPDGSLQCRDDVCIDSTSLKARQKP
jgi:hypothetical protein